MDLFEWLWRRLTGRPAPPEQMASSGSPPAPAARSGRKNPPTLVEGLELDASQFAALTDDEVRRAAQRLGNAWLSVWFGRRDLIPPETDPRTMLIDRAMVAHGLMTPEQLVEIHRIGREMEALRPDLAVAHQRAEDAVRQTKAQREALKQQKKAEAEARRQEHAGRVAVRKRTDIVYLGRGVSRALADRASDVERLGASGLPLLSTPDDVAAALGISVSRLRWLAFHAEAATLSHYVRFSVPKRSGGTRELWAPHRELAACQQWILRQILDRVPVSEAACGFVRGRSTLSNAEPHVGREVVVNADLEDFFPSVAFPRVRGAFRRLGYSPATSTVLALLCTEAPRRKVVYAGQAYHVATGPRALPQGACTSPALSNLAARRLDARLGGLARRLGWAYTRYADDLTFSASGPEAERVGYLLARLRHIVADEGFRVNEKKTRVQRQNTAQTVTGIVVNRRPGAPRKLVRRLRAILHRASTEGLAAQNREGRPHFEAWVRGMVAYVEMVNPQQGRPLRDALDAL